MSTNATDPTAGNSTAPAVPQIPAEVTAGILNAYAAGIRSPIGFVLIATVFASILIPILIALFYFSTGPQRRQPVFILNVFTILLGIGIAIWSNYLELAGILHPTKQVSLKAVDGFSIVFGFAPWFAELVLAMRLLVVFPPSRTPKLKLLAVFAFPVAVKIVRLSCNAVYWHNWIKVTDAAPNALAAAESVDYRKSPYSKVEWFLQIFDNFYLSALFIWRLYRSQIFNAMSGRRANDSAYTYPSVQNHITRPASNSLTERLKFLFWIALGNFVFPVIFNIILIIDLYVDPNYVVNTTYLLFANYYISIIGVVFATVWSATFNWKQQQAAATLDAGSSQGSSWRPKPSMSVSDTMPPPIRTPPANQRSFSPLDKPEEWELERASMSRDAIPLSVRVEKTQEHAV